MCTISVVLVDNHEHWSGYGFAPLSLKRAIDLAGAVTVTVLVLTEHFDQLPGALVAIAAGHLIGALGED